MLIHCFWNQFFWTWVHQQWLSCRAEIWFPHDHVASFAACSWCTSGGRSTLQHMGLHEFWDIQTYPEKGIGRPKKKIGEGIKWESWKNCVGIVFPFRFHILHELILNDKYFLHDKVDTPNVVISGSMSMSAKDNSPMDHLGTGGHSSESVVPNRTTSVFPDAILCLCPVHGIDYPATQMGSCLFVRCLDPKKITLLCCIKSTTVIDPIVFSVASNTHYSLISRYIYIYI